MREFSLSDIIKYYLKYFWIILIITIISFFIGVFYIEKIFVPTYKETTTIILGKSSSMKEGEISSSTITLYDSLINNYIKLLESRKLLSNVKEDLNLKYTVSELSEMVNYSISGSSQIIEISVINESDELAVKICKQIVVELKEQVFDIYGLDNIMIVDEAKANNKKIYNESIIIILETSLVFALSSILIIVKFIFSDSIIEVDGCNNVLEINILDKIIHQKTEDKLDILLNEKEENKFKNIRSKIVNDLEKNKIIMISSISNNISKSYITYHLSQSLSKINKKVLIIDANIKDGQLTENLSNNNIGLLDALNDDKLSLNIINTTNNIDFISIGNIEKIDLIASISFSNLLNKLKDNYDYIVIESPSFKNNFETTSILKETDSVILVGKLNKEKIHNLNNVKEIVQKQEKQILGIILVKEKKTNKYIKNKYIKKKNNKEEKNKLHKNIKKITSKKSSKESTPKNKLTTSPNKKKNSTVTTKKVSTKKKTKKQIPKESPKSTKVSNKKSVKE